MTLDCIRMTLYDFALSATAMTRDEKRIAKLSDELKPSEVIKHLGMPEYVELRSAQQHELAQIKIQEEREDVAFAKGWSRMQGRPVTHRRYRR